MAKVKSIPEKPWDGTVVWTTLDGDRIPMKDMTDSHLKNALKHSLKYDNFVAIKACELELQRRNFELVKEYLEIKE